MLEVFNIEVKLIPTLTKSNLKALVKTKINELYTRIQTRLNMQPNYGNYKADIGKTRLCPHYEIEDDTVC